jgi:hypothetical protein
MTGLRNRLVIDTMGEQNVSSLLLTDDEIQDALDVEIQLHKASGWSVSDYGQSIRFEKDGLIRWVWVRSRTPHDDTL